jgi:hypothetical protein
MDPRSTVAGALAVAIIATAVAIIVFVTTAHGGERMICHLEPMGESWHYRTKIAPQSDVRCWYDGPRMKPRSELYWAEAPTIPSMTIMTPEPEFILRWRGHPQGWDHKE